ncbi:MAG: ATP-binding cassette domain-containing protein [Leucobacter sp.]
MVSLKERQQSVATTETSTAARSRLVGAGAGWVLVALIEAVAYTILSLAIRDRGSVSLVIAAATVSLVVTVLVSRAGYLGGARLAGDLYASLGQSLARAKLSWFTADHRALITAAAGRGIPSLMGVPAHQLQTLILAPLLPAMIVAAVWVVSGLREASILAALLIAALAAQTFAQRRLARADSERHGIEHEVTAATVELVEHLDLLRTVAGPNKALLRVEQVWNRQEQAMARTNRAAAPATFISALASITPLAGIVIYLICTGGFAEPAGALALLILAGRAGAPLDDLALLGITVNELRAHSSAYRAVIAAQTLPVHPGRNSRDPNGHGIEVGSITQPPALDGVTVSIPEGTRLHLAGPSGSGKSTLLGLLMRFDDPARGTITLGGVPLKELSEHQITAHVAYVPQDPIVFTGTLAENVSLGRPGAQDDDIIDAVRSASLGEVVTRDPLGIHQLVGVHGQSLSQGERQRVAIARALVKNAPILILDEATSALDEATEQQVVNALTKVSSTLIFVTHRDARIWQPDHTIILKGHDLT